MATNFGTTFQNDVTSLRIPTKVIPYRTFNGAKKIPVLNEVVYAADRLA